MQGNQAVLLPTFYSEDTPASANETWARLHSDPLFAVSLQLLVVKSELCAARQSRLDLMWANVHLLVLSCRAAVLREALQVHCLL